MSTERNHLGQAIGVAVTHWTPPAWPSDGPFEGRFCRLERLDASKHAAALFAAYALDVEGRTWTYLPYGPFASSSDFEAWLVQVAARRDPWCFAIIDKTRACAVGLAAYLRIDPPNGSIEVGHLAYSALLQRTTAATEAMFLMMEHAFALGYRRYEWKCHALNEPSRQAALRLGFTFEGIFRQATIVKGRNRDTAWYSIIDSEWPRLRSAYEAWLNPDNFDGEGRQRRSLSAIRTQ